MSIDTALNNLKMMLSKSEEDDFPDKSTVEMFNGTFQVSIVALEACEHMINFYKQEEEVIANLDNGNYRQITIHDGAEWALKQIIKTHFPKILWE